MVMYLKLLLCFYVILNLFSTGKQFDGHAQFQHNVVYYSILGWKIWLYLLNSFCVAVYNLNIYNFTALCIKCWNCRSSNDPKCADPFDNSTVPITDCKQETGLKHLPGIRPSMCRKIRQKGKMLFVHTFNEFFLNSKY